MNKSGMIITRYLVLLSVACAPAPASIDTPTPRAPTYRATNLATAIDRLHVSREDDDGCAWFTLTGDGAPSSYADLVLTGLWSLHDPRWEPVQGCGDTYGPADYGQRAVDAAGSAEVHTEDDDFRSVDLDVTLTLADGQRIHFAGVVPID